MSSTTSRSSSPAARWVVAGVVTCTLLLGAACSSDSEPTAGPAQAETDDPGESEGGSSGDPGASQDDSTAGAEVATARVCDLITPFLDDVVEAFGTDLQLTENSPDGRLAEGCTLDLMDPEPGIDRESAIIEIARHTEVFSGTAEHAEQQPGFVRSPSDVSSVGGDALLLTGPTDDSVMVMFTSGGRVWSVKGTWGLGGAAAVDGHDLEQAMPEVARVVRAGLEATG